MSSVGGILPVAPGCRSRPVLANTFHSTALIYLGVTRIICYSNGAMAIDMKAMRRCAGPASDLLREMSNERRLLILSHLMQGAKSVSELEELIGISQSAVSQHLARLRRAELVKTRRDAQQIFYSLSGKNVQAVIRTLHRIFAR